MLIPKIGPGTEFLNPKPKPGAWWNSEENQGGAGGFVIQAPSFNNNNRNNYNNNNYNNNNNNYNNNNRNNNNNYNNNNNNYNNNNNNYNRQTTPKPTTTTEGPKGYWAIVDGSAAQPHAQPNPVLPLSSLISPYQLIQSQAKAPYNPLLPQINPQLQSFLNPLQSINQPLGLKFQNIPGLQQPTINLADKQFSPFLPQPIGLPPGVPPPPPELVNSLLKKALIESELRAAEEKLHLLKSQAARRQRANSNTRRSGIRGLTSIPSSYKRRPDQWESQTRPEGPTPLRRGSGYPFHEPAPLRRSLAIHRHQGQYPEPLPPRPRPAPYSRRPYSGSPPRPAGLPQRRSPLPQRHGPLPQRHGSLSQRPGPFRLRSGPLPQRPVRLPPRPAPKLSQPRSLLPRPGPLPWRPETLPPRPGPSPWGARPRIWGSVDSGVGHRRSEPISRNPLLTEHESQLWELNSRPQQHGTQFELMNEHYGPEITPWLYDRPFISFDKDNGTVHIAANEDQKISDIKLNQTKEHVISSKIEDQKISDIKLNQTKEHVISSKIDGWNPWNSSTDSDSPEVEKT